MLSIKLAIELGPTPSTKSSESTREGKKRLIYGKGFDQKHVLAFDLNGL